MHEFIKPLSDEFENIYYIAGARKGGYPYSNSLLIEDYLFDTGISNGYIKKLKRQFAINTVVSSHWHEDHIGGNRLLNNARFLCHGKDKPIIEDIINKIGPYYGFDSNTKVAESLISTLLEMYKLEDTKIDKTIEHGEIIDICDCKLRVIHTPGHTAGHCCFYEENSKIAFLADIDLTRFGPYYGCIDSSVIDFEDSIEKLEKLDIEIAVSGHKGVFSGKKLIKEELNNYKSKIYQYDERILSYLSEKKSVSSRDLMNKNIIYRKYGEWSEFEITSERIMIEKHFDKFLEKNIIEEKNDGFILT